MSLRSRALQLLQTSVIAVTVCLGASCHKEGGKPQHTQLISDPLRGELGVPPQSSQAEQLKTLQSGSPEK